MAQQTSERRKSKRRWLSWKMQVGVVAAIGAIAWVSRFAWFRAKRAVKSAAT